MQMVDDLFGFLPGVIQEMEVCGILHVCGHTGGINEELAFRGRGLVCSLLFDRFLFGWLGDGDQPGDGVVNRP